MQATCDGQAVLQMCLAPKEAIPNIRLQSSYFQPKERTGSKNKTRNNLEHEVIGHKVCVLNSPFINKGA